MTPSVGTDYSKLDWLGELAKRDKTLKFNNLMHHLSKELLSKAYFRLNKKAAKGVDGLSWKDYGVGLEERLESLHDRVQSGKYKPKAVKRVWIPKANGDLRPLGVTAIEDKIVQQALGWILEPIYETEFIGFSYGFRPGRKQHDALDAVYMAISTQKVSYVLDADMKAFFDTIDHEWMLKFLGHRISDKRILRLVKGWLKSGVMDDGKKHRTVVGTPQGAVISPLLANIYLHYALDLWLLQWRKCSARGQVCVVRYADDFVIGLQFESDGVRLKAALEARLDKFGLTLNQDKTHLIQFGRFAIADRKKRKQGKPETFDFLGFTHICSTALSSGKFKLARHTIKKKLRAKLDTIKHYLKVNMNKPIYEIGRWLERCINGLFNYIAVPGNKAAMNMVRTEINRYWLKVLRRRSHKGSNFTWSRFVKIIDRFFPHTRIRHPYPNRRFKPLT